MIFKGNETPYAQEMAKKEASGTFVGELIVSDAQINKSIEEYISQASISQEALRIIKKIADAYFLSGDNKAKLIADILKEEVDS